MPAVLTHKAIMLLARRRIRDVRDRLQRKVDEGVWVTDLEHRMLYLAKRAFEMMSLDEAAHPSVEFPEEASYTDGLGIGTSPFAVMGSMGPDLTGFSGLFLRNQAWVFDTVHKGTPDHEREPVVARTTDLALEIWRQARGKIGSREGEGDDFEAKMAFDLEAMRAYTLGHVCHVAADILSHPYVNDVEWHLGVRAGDSKRDAFSHSGTEGSIDALVARRLFGRPSTREGGQEWSVWWPPVDQVPPEFFAAYAEAFREMYFDDDEEAWPSGFGEFDERGGAGQPPLSAAFIKDGYSFYKHGVMSMGYGWGWWSWWGYLVPALVPALLMFPLLPAMPHGKQFLERAPWEVDERGWYEMLSLPLFLGTVPALFYGIWLATITTHGIEGDVIAGLINAGVGFVMGIIALSTVGVADLSDGVRWGLIWLVPFLGGVYHLVRVLVAWGMGDTPKLALFAIYGAPMLFMLIMFVLLGLVGMGITGIVSALEGDVGTSSAAVYGVFTALVIIGILVAWFVLPSILRDAKIPEEPKEYAASRRHFVRVFDDASLVHEASETDPDLGDRIFPSETRKLIKLWWTGPGEMRVRSRRTHLEFSFDGEGDPDQIVPSPLTMMTAREYGEHLKATVKAPDGTTGHLDFAECFEGEDQFFLPPGATFADEGDVDGDGDTITTVEDRFESTARFAKLDDEEKDSNYTLRHAPRLAQALRVGRSGPVSFDPREPGSVPGSGTVQSAGRDVTGADTDFPSFFDIGDRIQVGDQIRTVTLITSETRLKVNSDFNPALSAGTEYVRIGEHDEGAEGYAYVTDTGPGFLGGDRIMDRAADFAALLCLGATPHLLDESDLAVDTLVGRTFQAGGDAPTAVTPVHQVFRNWSLDRRRENEWRMLVSGGAFDEKDGDPTRYDVTMPDPRHDRWSAPGATVADGDAVLRRLGWVPVLREWLRRASPVLDDMTSEDGESPTNRELSRALAYLMDMPDPGVLRL